MIRAAVVIAAAAALWAAFLMPAFGQQIVCVPDMAAADKASRNAGEELAWVGQSGDTILLFYLGRETWSVFFQRPDGQWCTAPTMVGKIRRADPA